MEDLLTYKQEKEIGVFEASEQTIDDISRTDRLKENYKGIDLEVGFSCSCYELNDDSECGDVFYFKHEGTFFMGRFISYSEEAAIKHGKETIDKFLEAINEIHKTDGEKK